MECPNRKCYHSDELLMNVVLMLNIHMEDDEVNYEYYKHLLLEMFD